MKKVLAVFALVGFLASSAVIAGDHAEKAEKKAEGVTTAKAEKAEKKADAAKEEGKDAKKEVKKEEVKKVEEKK